MLSEAIEIARKEFEHKTDKAGKPYANHLWRVKEKVQEEYLYSNYELETVAVLHDLLEDCPEWNEERLSCLFPKSVVDSVICLTHKKNEPYSDYIDRVLTNDMVKMVKKADLEDNMDITRLPNLTEKDFKRLKKYHSAYKKICPQIEF